MIAEDQMINLSRPYHQVIIVPFNGLSSRLKLFCLGIFIVNKLDINRAGVLKKRSSVRRGSCVQGFDHRLHCDNALDRPHKALFRLFRQYFINRHESLSRCKYFHSASNTDNPPCHSRHIFVKFRALIEIPYKGSGGCTIPLQLLGIFYLRPHTGTRGSKTLLARRIKTR